MTQRLRRFVVAAALLTVSGLTACTYWSNDLERIVDQSGRDFKRDPGREYPMTNLEEVLAHPSSYKLMELSFHAVMNRRNEQIFVPLYSTFRPEDYMGFSVWPVAARLWEGGDRVKSIPTLYMRKDCPDMPKLIGLDRYALISCRGRVMGDYEGLPYIEVRYIDVIQSAMYTDESLSAMVAGMESSNQKRPAQAIQHFEAALKGSLGSGARVIAHMKLAAYYEERGNLMEAHQHYTAAAKEDPWNSAAVAGWERTHAALQKRAEAGEPPPQPQEK